MECDIVICSENKDHKCEAPQWFVDHWKKKAKWCPLLEERNRNAN